MPTSAELKEHYDTHGYVIVPGLLTPSEHADLLAATDRVVACTRSGSWPHARVVGKQFPPYGVGDDIWGVQHAMHPALGEPSFARWYAGTQTVQYPCEPCRSEFALCWHRDDIKGSVSEDEERAALTVRHYGDVSLYVVPGSHRVLRTAAQRSLSNDTAAPADPLAMPGAIGVNLRVGETVFYNNNILHCALYSPNRPRATLHACIGIRHDLEWMKEEAFRESLNLKGRQMLERLVRMQEVYHGKEIEYSLEG
ncbi:hypothetical protein BJV77DRAFT_1062082 [Russula vinacea]|nr:hypothetical protein BJV77DRAFT_1062082 [Russula vinacea]